MFYVFLQCTVNKINQLIFRELKTTILLNAQPTDKDVRSVVLKERFPSGMYIDLFETKSHEQFGGPKVYNARKDTIN